ncbi:mechanosensitive ion channel family protein [Flavobacteriaceae bacterium KMM 6897]|nr:mechanosensitive ion channel family protein [Flavobacteriaceae bacterium KMM 6897]MEB8344429.1 mechanosensitive ion channel family protein [Flavobacteriaceae bacterium KMM 6898]
MIALLQNISEKLLSSLENNWTMFIKQIPGILIAILIVTIGILISKKIGNLSRKVISRKSDDPIMVNFLAKGIKLILYTLFIMYALEVAGLQSIATGLLTAAGASAVIIGFAFKDIGENFISGIILSFNRPFNVNETVSIGDIFGKVKNIEFRYTKLRTFDGRDVYIPNSDVITKPVFNYTEDGFFRFDFMVGIGYEDNIGDAEKLIKQVIKNTEGIFEDETHPNFVMADALAVSTVNLKVHFWINTFEYGKEALMIKGKVITNVKEALLKEGFNLPADINELKLYGTQTSIPVSISK